MLRAEGIELVTLAEHYGVPADERVEDTTWIANSAERGWPALMKDERIRRRPLERAVIRRAQARCFCLANGNIPAAVMAERYLANMAAIEEACLEAGPFLYAVHSDHIRPLAIHD